jgi:hypothetical protein
MAGPAPYLDGELSFGAARLGVAQHVDDELVGGEEHVVDDRAVRYQRGDEASYARRLVSSSSRA